MEIPMVPKLIDSKCASSRTVAAALGLAFALVALANSPRVLAANDRFRATIPDGGAGEAGAPRPPRLVSDEATNHNHARAHSLLSRLRAPPLRAAGADFVPVPLARPESVF